ACPVQRGGRRRVTLVRVPLAAAAEDGGGEGAAEADIGVAGLLVVDALEVGAAVAHFLVGVGELDGLGLVVDGGAHAARPLARRLVGASAEVCPAGEALDLGPEAGAAFELAQAPVP